MASQQWASESSSTETGHKPTRQVPSNTVGSFAVSGLATIDSSETESLQDDELPVRLMLQVLVPQTGDSRASSRLVRKHVIASVTWEDGKSSFSFDRLLPGRHEVRATRYDPKTIYLRGILDVDKVTTKARLTLNASRAK